MKVTRYGLPQKLVAGLLAVMLSAVVAWADEVLINLEWRPATQTAFVGDTVDIGLYAVSADEELNQLFRALDMVFTWDPDYLELVGLDQTGAAPLLASSFPANDVYNLNEAVPPADGDGYYLAWANLGEPVEVTPAGVLLTTFRFEVRGVADETVLDIPPSGGDPTLMTTVWGGPGPNTNVTGTLGSASVTTLCMSCPGDLDGSGAVDLQDLARLLAHYGADEGAVAEDGDLNCDGDVDLGDLAALLAVYGTSCD